MVDGRQSTNPPARGQAAILPASARGDLDLARAGEPVYLYAYQVGDRPVPAATWRGTFVRAVDAIDGDHPEPEITPATWRADRVATEPATGLTAPGAGGRGGAALAGPSAA